MNQSAVPGVLSRAASAFVVFVVVFAGMLTPERAHAQGYLSEMPSVKEVLAKTKGAQQQYATLDRLMTMMNVLKGDHAFNGTRAESRLANTYNTTKLMIPMSGDRLKWLDGVQRYYGDPKFNRRLRAKFFSLSFRKHYAKAFAESEAAAARGNALIHPKRQALPPLPEKHNDLPPWWVYVLGGFAALIVFRIFLWAQPRWTAVVVFWR